MGEEREHQQRRVLPLEDRILGGRRQADLVPEVVPRLAPPPEGPLGATDQRPVHGRSQRDQAGHQRRRADHRWIVGGEEGERLQHGGDPWRPGPLRHEPGGEGERMRDQQVGAIRRRQGIEVGLPQRRHEHLAEDLVRATAGAAHPVHHAGIADLFDPVRANRGERQPQLLHSPLVELTGSDHRMVTAGAKAQRDRQVGMQISQRAERREDDSGTWSASRFIQLVVAVRAAHRRRCW